MLLIKINFELFLVNFLIYLPTLKIEIKGSSARELKFFSKKFLYPYDLTWNFWITIFYFFTIKNLGIIDYYYYFRKISLRLQLPSESA